MWAVLIVARRKLLREDGGSGSGSESEGTVIENRALDSSAEKIGVLAKV